MFVTLDIDVCPPKGESRFTLSLTTSRPFSERLSPSAEDIYVTFLYHWLSSFNKEELHVLHLNT